jgi:hypothetical protein
MNSTLLTEVTMANRFGNQFFKTLMDEMGALDGYIALDGSSNVVGLKSVTAKAANKAYTKFVGASKTLPVHTATGVYTITLDDPYNSLWNPVVTLAGAQSSTFSVEVVANVTGNATPATSMEPGQDPNTAAQTVVIKFRVAGTLTDPAASTGFWVHLGLKNSGT